MTSLDNSSKQSHNPTETFWDDGAEISLKDIWLIVVKHQYVMLAIFILIAALGAVYLYLAKPIYQSRAVLVIGEVASKGYVEKPGLVVKSLLEKYKVGDDSEGSVELPRLDKVSLSSSDGVLTLVSIGQSAEQAQSILKQIVAELLKEHDAAFKLAYLEQEALVSAKQLAVENINKEVNNISTFFDSLKSSNPTQASFVLIELGQLLERQSTLEGEYRLLQIELMLKSKPSRVLREPTLPVNPSKPKYKILFVVFFVFGILLAIVSAFMLELLIVLRKSLK